MFHDRSYVDRFLQDEEDMVEKEITSLKVPEARYTIEIESACAGNWVLLEGVCGNE